MLPVALFCSGHVYFTQRMSVTLGVQPYAVHATFQFSGTPGKRHRFREEGLWLEDSAYYTHPGGGGGRGIGGAGGRMGQVARHGAAAGSQTRHPSRIRTHGHAAPSPSDSLSHSCHTADPSPP